MRRRVSAELNVVNGSERGYDRQRPAICANGDCPIALTMGSQPSSNLGLGAGAGGVSAGPFTALRLLLEATGKRSLFRVRSYRGALRESAGEAVLVAESSRPTRKVAITNTAPPQPTRYPE